MMSKDLSEQQKRALDIWFRYEIQGKSQKEAAEKAGYASKSAAQQMNRLLSKDKAKAYLKRKQQQRATREVRTLNSLEEEMYQLYQRGISVNDLKSAISALEKVIKMKGGFTDKLEVEHKDSLGQFLKDIKDLRD